MALKPCFARLFKKDEKFKFGQYLADDGKTVLHSDDLARQQVASIWKLAAAEADKGTPFRNVYKEPGNPSSGLKEQGVIEKLHDQIPGLKPEWIIQAFTEPKALRSVTLEMWNKMNARRQYQNNARQLVRDMDTPQWEKTLNGFYNLPRSLLITGHALVFPWTHTGQSLTVPSEWGLYFGGLKRAWSVMMPTKASVARYMQDMQSIQDQPGYNFARRASASVQRDYTPVGIFGKQFGEKLFGKKVSDFAQRFSGGSRRGMGELNLTRMKMFSKEWVRWGMDNLKEDGTPMYSEAQKLEFARMVMRPVEHATGIFMGKGIVQRSWMSRLVFAPQLIPARWASSLTDPIRAVRVFGNWKNATLGERAAASFVAKRTAQSIATTASILALNEAINKMVGSPHHVNITDPTKADWLRLKVAGYNVPMSFTYEPIRLAIQMIAAGHKPRRGESTSQAFLRPLGQYGVSKLHPTIGKVVEGLYGRQMITERPLPFAKAAPFFEPRKKEKAPVGIGEYIASVGPIPFGEGARELHHLLTEEGMSKEDATVWIRALAFAALGSVGPRPSPIKEPVQKQKATVIP